MSAVSLKKWFETHRHKFTGQLLFDESLARHTYYRIGGPAQVFAVPKTRADLLFLGQTIRETGTPFLILGAGSNLLVRDKGYPGLVIYNQHLNREISSVGRSAPPNRIRTGSSVPITVLLKAAMEKGWGGLEFLCGIPGTIGGAVVMNAGTALGEVGNRVLRVEAIPFTDPHCEVMIFEDEKLKFVYRSEQFLPAHTLVWAAEWSTTPSKPELIKKTLETTLLRRKATQPLDFPSCGCIFKNPKGTEMKAWEVINKAGLRGSRIGNAQFSVKHSNFIVNLGNATAEDVLRLVELAQRKAREEQGIELEMEVKVVGE